MTTRLVSSPEISVLNNSGRNPAVIATGVELAGALAELARYVLKRDFRHIDPQRARVILLEASPRILAHFPPDPGSRFIRRSRKENPLLPDWRIACGIGLTLT